MTCPGATSPSTRWRWPCPTGGPMTLSLTCTAASNDLAAQGPAYAGNARGVLRRRPAADAAGCAVRRPTRLHRRARGGRGDGRHGGAAVDRQRGAGPRGAHPADARPGPAGWPRTARRYRPGRRGATRTRRPCGWRSTSTTSTRTSTSTRCRSLSAPSRLETDGPDLILRLAAVLHDIGKPADPPASAGRRCFASTTTRLSAPRWLASDCAT